MVAKTLVLIVSGTLLAIGGVPIAGSVPTDGVTPPNSSTPTTHQAEQEAEMCGPRAVFCVLQGLGISVPYETVRDSITRKADESESDGISIADLQEYMASVGVDSSVRRISPSDMPQTPVPFIIYYPPQLTGGQGHFVCVQNVHPDGLDVVDPVLGKKAKLKWYSFCDRWDGTCLIPTSRDSFGRNVLWGCIALHLVLLVGYWQGSRTRLSKAIAPVMVLAILSLPSPCEATDDGSAAEDAPCQLRTNERSLQNAVSLVMSAIQQQDSNAEKGMEAATVQGPSIGDAQNCLTRHGIQSSLRKLTYQELIRQDAIQVLVLRHGSETTADFGVFVNGNDDQVTFVRTGPMTISVWPVDEFRRAWTGHSLLVSKPQNKYMPAVLSLSAGAVVGTLGLFFLAAFAAVRSGADETGGAVRTPLRGFNGSRLASQDESRQPKRSKTRTISEETEHAENSHIVDTRRATKCRRNPGRTSFPIGRKRAAAASPEDRRPFGTQNLWRPVRDASEAGNPRVER
ncbi:MAG: cysteine peptidase family C39 domain-containing protein [Planctomycetota bacterium]